MMSKLTATTLVLLLGEPVAQWSMCASAKSEVSVSTVPNSVSGMANRTR